MSNVSLVISDVDGTLLTKDKVLTARAAAAVKAVQAAGIKFALRADGRRAAWRCWSSRLRLRLPSEGSTARSSSSPT
jgi:ribonucleotide monophosphatase NagD (HAD superfamily)